MPRYLTLTLAAGFVALSLFGFSSTALADHTGTPHPTTCPGGGTAPPGFICPTQPPTRFGGDVQQTLPGSRSDDRLRWAACRTADCRYERGLGNSTSNGWTAERCTGGFLDLCAAFDGAFDNGAAAIGRAVVGDPNYTAGNEFADEMCRDRSPGTDPVSDTIAWAIEGLCYGVVNVLSHIFSFQNIFYWLGFLTYWLLMIAQVFLGLAMWWLDGAIYYAVVLMGAYINHDLTRAGIYLAWGIIRDLCNILIIGGFIAVGISTILRVAEYAADRFLVKLIIAALLVNFSYFFAGAIIDAANYVTVQIYYSDFIENNCAVGSQSRDEGGSVLRGPGGGIGIALGGDGCRIARSMMAYTHMTSWDKIRSVSRQLSGFSGEGSTTPFGGQTSTDGNTGETVNQRELNETNLYWYLMILSLLGAAFAMLLGWIFIQGAFMLMMRFVSLLFLLVVSPIGIAGVAIPYVNHYAGRWWSALFAQAVFAPVYVFLLGVSLSVVKGFAGMWGLLGSQDGFAAALTAAPAHGQGWLTTHLPLFMLYFIAVACLWLSYQFAKQIAESVPEFKPLYDMAAKGATGAFLLPKRMAVDTGGKMVRSFVVDPLAARTKEKGWARFGLTGLSAGMRQLERIGSSKKPEKSAWEEAHSEIKDQGRARPGQEEYNEMEGRGLSAGHREGFRAGWLYQNPSDWSEDTKKRVKDYLAKKLKSQEDMDEFIAEHGQAKVDKLIKMGVIDKDKQLELITDSKSLSEAQKSQMVKSYFDANGFNAAARDGKDGDWERAAAIWETMTNIERDILRAERKEVIQNAKFQASLKSKDSADSYKGMSREDIALAKKARKDGVTKELGDRREGESDAQHAERIKKTLARMSDDEIGDLDKDTALRVIPHMNPSQKKALFHKNTDKEVGDRLRDDPDVKIGTGGYSTPPPPPTPPPAEENKDKK